MAGNVIFTVLGLGFALSLGACAGTSDGDDDTTPATATTPIACDPLAPKPITLEAIIGVGSDANGTNYVDAVSGIFVSTSSELDRQHVTGTGQGGTNEYLFDFEPADDPTQAQTLLVETDPSGFAQAMGLGMPNSRAFLDDADSGATLLTLGDPMSVARLPVVNTPNEISYVGDVADGSIVFATVPMNLDETSESGGLSIFYGPAANVAERQVTAFEQSLSNDGTVTFLVDNASYVLAFGTVNVTSDNPLGDFTLESLTPGTGTPLAVTLRSPTPTELPSGLSFTCMP